MKINGEKGPDRGRRAVVLGSLAALLGRYVPRVETGAAIVSALAMQGCGNRKVSATTELAEKIRGLVEEIYKKNPNYNMGRFENKSLEDAVFPLYRELVGSFGSLEPAAKETALERMRAYGWYVVDDQAREPLDAALMRNESDFIENLAILAHKATNKGGQEWLEQYRQMDNGVVRRAFYPSAFLIFPIGKNEKNENVYTMMTIGYGFSAALGGGWREGLEQPDVIVLHEFAVEREHSSWRTAWKGTLPETEK